MDSCIRRCKQNKGIVGTNRFESGLCNFPLNLVQRAIFNCACRRSLAEYVVKKSSKHIKLILVLKIYWILVVSIQAACKNVVKCFARDLGSSHRETLVKKNEYMKQASEHYNPTNMWGDLTHNNAYTWWLRIYDWNIFETSASCLDFSKFERTASEYSRQIRHKFSSGN